MSYPRLPLSRVVQVSIIKVDEMETSVSEPDHIEFSDLVYSAANTDSYGLITVRRIGKGLGSCSVNYLATPGTAVAGVDFTPVSGMLTWDDGDVADKTFQVPIRQSVQDDNGRYFFYNKQSASYFSAGSPDYFAETGKANFIARIKSYINPNFNFVGDPYLAPDPPTLLVAVSAIPNWPYGGDEAYVGGVYAPFRNPGDTNTQQFIVGNVAVPTTT